MSKKHTHMAKFSVDEYREIVILVIIEYNRYFFWIVINHCKAKEKK